MTLLNEDLKNEKREELMAKMQKAASEGDTELFAQTFTEFTEDLQNSVIEEAKQVINSVDTNVLASRGIRQLTSKETEFYNKIIKAMGSNNPRAALSELEVVMPETVVDSVFEELKSKHELLEYIDFQNATGLTKFLLNKSGKQLAQWGPLCSEIVKELTGGFEEVSMVLNKLTSWIPVCQDMLDLGPVWLDRYVRTLLYESIAYGLEEGIINGDGKDKPIGMVRDISESAAVVNGAYPFKKKVKLNSFSPLEYAKALKNMATNENGKVRVIKDVILIVNPIDYLLKIFPATTIRGADGRFVNDVLPFPTKVIQSEQIEEGSAVLGMGKRYFMGLGLNNKDGKIEHSDEYKFLEDQRVYKIKLYGNGMAKDNNDFVYLDISDLQPAVQEVKVINSGETVEGK